MNEKDCPNNKVVSTKNNHFTASDHNAITRVKHIIVQAKESLNLAPKNNNHFVPSDENMSSNKYTPVIKNPNIPAKHPIVNLCQSYVESVFFQLDSAPGTKGTIQFNNQKQGRIIGFTYFLDSSMNDNVLINIDIVSGNKGRKSLLNFVEGGNTFIKGTNNSMALKFKCNKQIFIREQLQITYANTSSQDCTIMAIADIKYGEEDFV